MHRETLKELILAKGWLDGKRLRELEALAVSGDRTLLDALLQGGHIREDALLPAVAAEYGVEWLDLDGVKGLDPECWRALPPDLRDSQEFLPLKREGERVLVAVVDLEAVESLDRCRQVTGWLVRPVLVSRAKMERAREWCKQSASGETVPGGVETQPTGAAARDDRSLAELANEAPVIKQVNLLLMQAVAEGASDIHLEPGETEAVVRNRVDGVLHEVARVPAATYPALVSRLKIMAGLNIAEHRLPLDGRIGLRLMDRPYDVRIATVPALHGEGVVLRILDEGSLNLDLARLGFPDAVLAAFRRQIARPYGLVLVTGPTGSGKTTTLYAALASIKSQQIKIITIEDPVEYHLAGVLQIHVNPQVGLTFSVGLRSILRMDPDIAMVGEVRDTETAEIAIRAALTGHLVFSTLHTNDAVSALTRLTDMGIPTYLLAASLNAVLSQRLVRRICSYCQTSRAPAETERLLFEAVGEPLPTSVQVGVGCDECHGAGFSGRLGVYELFEITEAIRPLLCAQTALNQLRELACQQGMATMLKDGADKVRQGLTTAAEVLRVTQL
jgi:type II secretory ATPase GspE/PulE/Tfp pilus assembly ATPase PilB-like protein